MSPPKPSFEELLLRGSNYSPNERDVWYNQRLPQHAARDDTDRDRGKLLWERNNAVLQRSAYNNHMHVHWGGEGGSTLSEPALVMMRPEMSAWQGDAVPQTTTFTFVKSTPQPNAVESSTDAAEDEVVDPPTSRTVRSNRRGKGKK